MSMSAADVAYMARALRLAERGLFTTDPNPRVGCVIVKDGAIVGEGWHERAGEPHAEVHALREAGARAQGATVYVSLEPCCHHGRTPPCTDALIQAGVARVVAAMIDPNPRVGGSGLDALRAAGIAAEAGALEAEAIRLNPGFVQRMRVGRPHVRLKLAASLDGRTALESGESKWITGEAARADVHRFRARSSAIVTGIGTVLADDPAMTVRGVPGARNPLRVVVDSRLRTPKNAQMLGLPGGTLIACAQETATTADALRAAGADILALPGKARRVDLAALMHELAAREINEVWVEAGPALAGGLIEEGLVNEVLIYFAPQLLGDGARGLAHLPAIRTLADRVELGITDVRAVGRDWRITATMGKQGA